MKEKLYTSKAQYHRHIGLLTCEEQGLLRQGRGENGEVFYTLRGSFDDLYGLSKEEAFLLEAYKHIGSLLDQSFENLALDTKESGHDLDELKRKFFYLSKIQARPFEEKHQAILKSLTKALLNNKIIFVHYQSKNDSNASNARKIKPLSLCMYRDDLYFFGEEEIDSKWVRKSYKVSRITKTIDSIEVFTYPSHMRWNPETLFSNSSGIMLGEGRQADIKIYSHFRKTLKEKNFMNANLIMEHLDFDHYEFVYTNVDEFLGQLATYAECIEVIGPPELVEAWERKLNQALGRLKKSNKRKAS